MGPLGWIFFGCSVVGFGVIWALCIAAGRADDTAGYPRQ